MRPVGDSVSGVHRVPLGISGAGCLGGVVVLDWRQGGGGWKWSSDLGPV